MKGISVLLQMEPIVYFLVSKCTFNCTLIHHATIAGAQAATAGMLPPSDSEEDGDEDKGDTSAPARAAVDKKKIAPAKPAKDEEEEEEEDDSDESESSDDAPINEYLSGPPRQKKWVPCIGKVDRAPTFAC